MLYRCKTKITTAEAWTPAHWVQVSVGEDLSKAVWNEVQNLTVAQQSAARNNIQAADQMTVDFHSTQISDLETGKQDKLTFDSTPTAGSSNPVTSAGIKAATDALAGDVDDLKSALSNVENAVGYSPIQINVNKTIDTFGTGKVIKPENIAKYNGWCCVCVPCAEGDVFHVTGKGGATTRLWAFSDTNGAAISPQAGSGATGNELEVIAPENAAYFAFNSNMNVPYDVYKGNKPDKRLDALESDMESLSESVDELSGEVSEVQTSVGAAVTTVTKTDDIGTSMTWTDGYITLNGTPHASDSYHYSEQIPVNEGDILNTRSTFRFLTAYSNGVAVEAKGAELTQSYTVPEGVTSVIASIYNASTNLFLTHPVVVNSMEPRVETIEAQIETLSGGNGTVVKASAESVTNGQMIKACENIDNKKGDTIFFYAKVAQSTFGSVTVGHGYNVSYGASVTVDATNITTAYGTNANYYHTPHGLTIDKFLMVEVIHTDNARAKVRITTEDGSYEVASSLVAWGGCRGDVFALSTNSTLSDVRLSCTFADFVRDIFLFGDSYVGLGDDSRYSTVLVSNGYTNLMIDGYGGRNSASAITSFRNVITMAKPKYVIWALGMNDSDTESAINASYKSCLDEVLATCETYNITPIVATIPNVPERLHTFKNAYIKSLNCRILDLAAAVGAENAGAYWYNWGETDAMLSSDEVHPTQYGAKALYAMFLADVPEIADLP